MRKIVVHYLVDSHTRCGLWSSLHKYHTTVHSGMVTCKACLRCIEVDATKVVEPDPIHLVREAPESLPSWIKQGACGIYAARNQKTFNVREVTCGNCKRTLEYHKLLSQVDTWHGIERTIHKQFSSCNH